MLMGSNHSIMEQFNFTLGCAIIPSPGGNSGAFSAEYYTMTALVLKAPWFFLGLPLSIVVDRSLGERGEVVLVWTMALQGGGKGDLFQL